MVLVVYVLPKFRTFFATLNAKLPFPTRVLLDIAGWLGHWGIIAGVLIVAAVIGMLLGARTERGKEIKDTVVLKIPMVGDLVHTAIVERFCRLLASMTMAGVSLPEAIAVTTAATNNVVFRRGFD